MKQAMITCVWGTFQEELTRCNGSEIEISSVWYIFAWGIKWKVKTAGMKWMKVGRVGDEPGVMARASS